MRALKTCSAVAILFAQFTWTGCKSTDRDFPSGSAPTASKSSPPSPPAVDTNAGSSSSAAVAPEPETVRETGKIGIALKLARGFESGSGIGMGFGGGFRYEMLVEIGNPNSTPFSFDAIVMKFTNGMNEPLDGPMYLTGQTIRFTEHSIVTSYQYGDSPAPAGLPERPENGEPIVMIVEGHRAISFPSSISAALRPTRSGEPPTVISATLMLADKPVTEVYRAALPPLSEIPDEFQVRDDEAWYPIMLVPVSGTPSRSR